MGIIQKELFRKAFHLTGLAVPILYYFFLPRGIVLLGLAAAVAIAGSMEAFRLSGRDIYPDILLRDPSEKKRLYGYFWGLLSMLLAVFLFDKAIAIASVLFMLLGDSAAGITGAFLAHYTTGKADVRRMENTPSSGNIFNTLKSDFTYSLSHYKSPYVMAAMFLVCTGAGLLLYPAISLPVIVAGAAGATIAEAFPWRVLGRMVNDNLSIPLASGAIMALVATLLSYWQ